MIWKAAKLPKGYGKINDGEGRTVAAHRVSWRLKHGAYPELAVLHKCDNPACVNPDHLFLGTLADNNEDMRQKGRKYSKLSKEQATEILRRCHTKLYPHKVLAAEYGVSLSLIRRISCRQSWFHIPQP
jgi:hypothetical protein